MTDSEKIDLLLKKITGMDQKFSAKFTEMDEKFVGIDQRFTGIEKDIVDIKADLKRLQQDDALILDEVERVHVILEKHKSDKSVHTA